MLKQFEQMESLLFILPLSLPTVSQRHKWSSGSLSVILSCFAKVRFSLHGFPERGTQTLALRKPTFDGIILPQEQNYYSERQ